jgi:DNA invertase Pin-like site-specific DNA recombinase
MARKIGYCRVSTEDQDLTIQKAALKRDGCHVIFEEKVSGAKRDGREKLTLALKVLGPGDSLVVTRLDRLGRSLRDLANIAHEIESAGASLRVLDQSVDTATSAGKAFFGMLAVFAQFETDVRRERQAEGIAKIMADPQLRQSRYRGGTARIDAERVQILKREGLGPSAIAVSLGISRMSVYRVLKSNGIAKSS